MGGLQLLSYFSQINRLSSAQSFQARCKQRQRVSQGLMGARPQRTHDSLLEAEFCYNCQRLSVTDDIASRGWAYRPISPALRKNRLQLHRSRKLPRIARRELS